MSEKWKVPSKEEIKTQFGNWISPDEASTVLKRYAEPTIRALEAERDELAKRCEEPWELLAKHQMELAKRAVRIEKLEAVLRRVERDYATCNFSLTAHDEVRAALATERGEEGR